MVLLFVQLFLEIVLSNPECSGVVVHHLVDLVELCCPFGDVFFISLIRCKLFSVLSKSCMRSSMIWFAS